MAITPQTDLFLVKCPLQLSNKHQLTFNSKDEQFNYFRSLPRLEIDQISYIRKDNVIRFPANIDEIIEYNYCMYRNDNYSNKWFYAFITDMRYVNDNMTFITLKTDVFQTWQFDLNWRQSFIEREMVTDDSVGLHTVPENLNIGDLVCDNVENLNELGSESYYYIVIACNYNPAGTGATTSGIGIYGDYPQGCMWFAWLINRNNFTTEINEISQWIYDVTLARTQ